MSAKSQLVFVSLFLLGFVVWVVWVINNSESRAPDFQPTPWESAALQSARVHLSKYTTEGTHYFINDDFTTEDVDGLKLVTGRIANVDDRSNMFYVATVVHVNGGYIVHKLTVNDVVAYQSTGSAMSDLMDNQELINSLD